tara:strand:+ start:158 stop:1723 length:1566 start_codon:yes stop_codon:yes gene_type:complete
MPADFSRYVDLTAYDADPTDIYLGALRLARLTLPEFRLRQGTVEDALFQACAYMQALNVAAINRVPNRLMEGVARIIGVARDEGTRAKVDVTVSLNEVPEVGLPFTLSKSSAFTYSISYPSGDVAYPFMTTRIETFTTANVRVASTGNVAIASELENGDTVDGVTLATDDRVLLKDQTAGAENGIYVVVASGAASRATDADTVSELPLFISVSEGTVGIGTSWNMTNIGEIVLGTTAVTYAAGTYPSKTFTLVSKSVGVHPTPTAGQIVESATIAPEIQTAVVAVAPAFSVGSNPESDAKYMDRCVTHLQGLSSTAITTDQLKTYILTSHANIARCSVYNTMTTGARGLDQFGSGPTVNAGYVLVVVYGQNRLLTSTERTTIQIATADRTSAGLTVAIEDPVLIDLEIAAEVIAEKRRNSADMVTDIQIALRRSLTPGLWRGSAEAIMASEIVNTIRNVDGVISVTKATVVPTSGSASNTVYAGNDSALSSAGNPNVYFVSAGTLPDFTQSNATITVTIES